ncbi:hypothetical protein CEXT_428841 [Caerostris extrusa]|uniref:Uncharacterized protein n=1 Tax=Caerostris extrusa TaxID=172846 RepID=A0AAV4MKW1_CAEEX|nr:hypothetical protein CEXT_428841 [Caerostris extrusa]
MISPAGGIPAVREIMVMEVEKSMRSFEDGETERNGALKCFSGRLRACWNELKLGLEIPSAQISERRICAPPTIYRNSGRQGE